MCQQLKVIKATEKFIFICSSLVKNQFNSEPKIGECVGTHFSADIDRSTLENTTISKDGLSKILIKNIKTHIFINQFETTPHS